MPLDILRQLLLPLHSIINFKTPKKRYYGTGSYPLPPQGWQRLILFIASQVPLNKPCFFKASAA